jgi:hypothetical protein
MKKPSPIRRARPSEEGYMLVAAIFMLALFTIALAVALPKVIKEIQRDRELETMHRGKQYARAVRLYYKKFGAYPPNVDALVKPTNKIRFLRKKYVDLTTGKEEWKPVRFGQNKAPTVMGFFGKPMGGVGGCPPNPLGGNTSQGTLSSGGIGGTTSPSTFGGTSNPTTSSSSNCGPTGLNTSSDTATTTGGTPPPTDPNAANTNTTTSSTTGQPGQSGSTTGLSGQTFGGGAIIGFSPNSPKQTIMVYKTKNHYNEWEFVYDPIAEQMMQGGNTGGIGQPASATTTPIGGTPTTTNTTPTTTANPSPTTTTTPPQ